MKGIVFLGACACALFMLVMAIYIVITVNGVFAQCYIGGACFLAAIAYGFIAYSKRPSTYQWA